MLKILVPPRALTAKYGKVKEGGEGEEEDGERERDRVVQQRLQQQHWNRSPSGESVLCT